MRLKKQTAIVAFHSQLSAILEKLMVLAVEEIKELVFDLCEEISPEKSHNQDLFDAREEREERLYHSSDSFYVQPRDEYNEPQNQMSQTTSRDDTKEKHGSENNYMKFPRTFSNNAQETATNCKFEQAATSSPNPSSSREEENYNHESRQTSFEPPEDSKNHPTDYSSAEETQCTTYEDVSTNQEDHSRDVAFHVKQEEETPGFETGNCSRFQMQTGQMETQVQPIAQESLVNRASFNTAYNLAFASLNMPRPLPPNLYVHKTWNNPSVSNTQTLPDANKVLFKCEHCSKTYRFPSLLKAHYLKHTQEKQLACRFCGKPFKWEYSLRRHERTYCGKY